MGGGTRKNPEINSLVALIRRRLGREAAPDEAAGHTKCGMVRPAGIEPATYGFEARRSIQLSYGRTWLHESCNAKACQGYESVKDGQASRPQFARSIAHRSR